MEVISREKRRARSKNNFQNLPLSPLVVPMTGINLKAPQRFLIRKIRADKTSKTIYFVLK